MKSSWRNFRYAAFGSSGALVTLSLGSSCNGACSSCFGCVLAGGSLTVLALVGHLKAVSNMRPSEYQKKSDFSLITHAPSTSNAFVKRAAAKKTAVKVEHAAE